MRYLFFVIAKNNKKSMKRFLKSNGLHKFYVSKDTLEKVLTSVPLASSGLFKPYDPKECKKNHVSIIKEVLKYKMNRGELIFLDALSMVDYMTLAKEFNYTVRSMNFDEGVVCDRPQGYEMTKVCSAMEALLGRTIVHRSDANVTTPHYWEKFNIIADEVATPLDFSRYKKVHHIGDIHGCHSVLMEYFKNHAPAMESDEAYVFTGDYFDRGIENDQVFNFLSSISKQENVFLIVGNHEKTMIDIIRKRVTDPLDVKTSADFKKAKITDDKIVSLYEKMVDCVYYKFHDRTVLVTHGGIDKFPKQGLIAIPSYDMIKGVGKNKKCLKINEKFFRNTKGRIYQVHGHRNPDNAVSIEMNARCFNVCGMPEHGAMLRSVIFSEKDINKIETKNDVYSLD